MFEPLESAGRFGYLCTRGTVHPTSLTQGRTQQVPPVLVMRSDQQLKAPVSREIKNVVWRNRVGANGIETGLPYGGEILLDMVPFGVQRTA
jgi:hypothetical protein